ncbi:MAG TPA: aldose 1-epimerase family protein [Spirochaetia bacterium]|nr:aldose 1-epimerase family protein [Spirochaetia bacterium]
MANFHGKEYSKQELLSYIGDPGQLAGARPSVLCDGKSEGVKSVEVNTGGGLYFTILPGRGMDIPYASYKGKALSFSTGTGVTSPAYYEEPGFGWLRSFFAGLLTTCGITNAGAPGEDQNQAFGLHGRVSNAGAEDTCIRQCWEGDEYFISVEGTMREVSAMGENMRLRRSIRTSLGARSFRLKDDVENCGFESQPLMMLYHFNFGFPLLSPQSRILAPVLKTEGRDEQARKDKGVEEALVFSPPVPGYREKVFLHTLGGKSKTFIALVNPDTGDGTPLGIILRFNKSELPFLTEWKMPRKGFYALGLEPGTVSPLGRGVLRHKGELPLLEAQSTYSITIDFAVIESQGEIRDLEKEAESLNQQG